LIRITGGNFRLLDRLLTQIGRILELNGLELITREVVEAARSFGHRHGVNEFVRGMVGSPPDGVKSLLSSTVNGISRTFDDPRS
jgi:hypothetical protein